MLFILTSFDLDTVGPKGHIFTKVTKDNVLSIAGNVLTLASKGHDSYVTFSDKDIIVPFTDGLNNLGISIAYVVYRDGQVLVPYDTYFTRYITLSNMSDINTISGEGDNLTDPSTVSDYYDKLGKNGRRKSKDLWYNINKSSFDDDNESGDEPQDFDPDEDNVLNNS